VTQCLLGRAFRNRCFGALYSSCLDSIGRNRRLTTICQDACECGTGCYERQWNQCQAVGAVGCRRLLNNIVSVKFIWKDQAQTYYFRRCWDRIKIGGERHGGYESASGTRAIINQFSYNPVYRST